MHLTPTSDNVITYSPACVAASRLLLKQWAEAMTVGTTAQREAQAISDSMKTTPTDSERSAIDMGQVGLLITESGWFNVSE